MCATSDRDGPYHFVLVCLDIFYFFLYYITYYLKRGGNSDRNGIDVIAACRLCDAAIYSTKVSRPIKFDKNQR